MNLNERGISIEDLYFDKVTYNDILYFWFNDDSQEETLDFIRCVLKYGFSDDVNPDLKLFIYYWAIMPSGIFAEKCADNIDRTIENNKRLNCC